MKPELLALMTAMAWGIGGYFEKKGLVLGHLSPQMGITIRTAVALLILGAVSFPQWKTLPQAGSKALWMMVLGGGVVAGAVGMLCFYAAIKGARCNGHADRLHLAAVRRADGHPAERRAADLAGRRRYAADGWRDRSVDNEVGGDMLTTPPHEPPFPPAPPLSPLHHPLSPPPRRSAPPGRAQTRPGVGRIRPWRACRR